MSTFLQQLVNGVSLGSIYGLIALGYTMVYGILRLINFAHGDVYMVGAYVGYYLSRQLRGGEPSFVRAAGHDHRALRLPAGPARLQDDLAHHGDRRVALSRERRPTRLRPQSPVL